MRSLLIIITFIAFVQLNAIAQSYLSGNSSALASRKIDQPAVNSVQDSLKMIHEKEWNKHLIINSDSPSVIT